jgi:acetoacetyl-CoA synthetase
MDRFRHAVAAAQDLELTDSRQLHAWSLAHPRQFWRAVWDHAGVVGDPGPVPGGEPPPRLPDAGFFPAARLNVVDTYLRGPADRSEPAVIGLTERGDRRVLSWEQLGAAVASAAAGLRALGVRPGDRVAAWMPNVPETVVAFLATAAVGAVFSSTSPDFGPDGVVDRFGQIEPVVLLAADGYSYAGTVHRTLDRIDAITSRLPSLRAVVVVPLLGTRVQAGERLGAPRTMAWSELVATESPLVTEPLPFDHPGLVLYSSGTTGRPKCIVHRAAGVLLKHLSEHQLHCDVRPGDRVLYVTTCGWMMWNWLVGSLAAGATIVLYDGQPFHPSPAVLFDVVGRYGVTLLGVSAKYIDSLRVAGVHPAATHRLATLRTICSTGSPLSSDGFRFVYEHVAPDVHLASISGGTDLCGCFVAGDPTRPVFAGEIQGPCLGMDVDVFGDDGTPLGPERTGELVCRTSFPSVPLGFLGDTDGSRFHDAYFARFPGVWTHGDFASWTEHGGVVIHGRSDATLNVGGVRIGTAELYRVVESFPEVREAVAVAQQWDRDTRIVLFVAMAPGHELDDALRRRVAQALREQVSPRHVPAVMLAVDDIPRTRSGKITELAVADVVNGRPVRNREALANPDALDLFRDRPELR